MELKEGFDWSVPQRQPVAGLVIVFVKTCWQLVKRLWPFVIILLLRDAPAPGKTDRFEILAAVLGSLTLIGSLLEFYFFRFSILGNELIIKKGWYKKETIAIPFERIQTVNIEQSFLHQALGIVKLGIDTAGSNKTEVTIDALNRGMAESLRARLSEKGEGYIASEETLAQPVKKPLIVLSGSDLMRLSLSANHLETFFLLISFGLSIFGNLQDIWDDIEPSSEDLPVVNSMTMVAALIATILVVTILISTVRIILRFWDFRVTETGTGFNIRSGLGNVKERMVSLPRIQYISWKANWIREKLGIWLLEYHIAGADEQKAREKVQVPVTRSEFMPVLLDHYHSLPETEGDEPIRIHRLFVIRKILLVGLLPALVFMAASWTWLETGSLFVLLYAAWISGRAIMFQRKFRLWNFHDVLYRHSGVFGKNRMVLQWNKVQTVALKQSSFQRRKGLATIVLYTAGGIIRLPYLEVAHARAIMNYSMYRVETDTRGWM